MPGTALKLTGLSDLQKYLQTAKTEIQKEIINALDTAGEAIAGEAKRNLETHIDLSNLHASIYNTVDTEDDKITLTVGTPQQYGIYIEYGTGIYAENGNGRKTPWYWTNDAPTSNWYGTHKWIGSHPHPFLRPALTARKEEAVEIMTRRISEALTK